MLWVLGILLSSLLFPSLALSIEPNLSYKDGDVIAADTTWSGRVEVSGIVFIPDGVTLTIQPGTVVAFGKVSAEYKESAEGAASEVIIPGSGLRVEGRVVAEGKKGGEITFTSAEKNPAPGDWGCIFLDHSKGSVFNRCRFEYSAYTIHAHFSSFDVSRSLITQNEDGSRLGITRASYDHCDIRDNAGKGLNFRQSKVDVRWCNITGNQDGVFMNEKDAACDIEDNNIHGNGMDLRLGDFHKESVRLSGDWWGTADPKEIAGKVWDKADDPDIGRAVIEPAQRHIAGAGVDGPEFQVMWKFKTGGFVDCNPAVDNGVVYFDSWDKKFCAVKADTGELLWSFQAGDCVDSSPAVADDRVFFGSWDRNIYCLDAKDGKLVWSFPMPPSNFDDHRQSSPAVSGGTVYMGGFNGFLYALDAATGRMLWKFQTGGPIRSRPLASGKAVVVGSGGGTIYALGPGGDKLWDCPVGSPVNSSPADAAGGVAVGSRGGTLLLIKGGRKVWSYETGRVEYSSPLVCNGLVIIGDCTGTLHAVNQDTGKGVWKFTGGGGIYSSPRLSGRYVVYGDNAGDVYALDPSDGSLVSRFKAGRDVQGLSTGPDGAVYAGSRDGFLYKLGLGE